MLVVDAQHLTSPTPADFSILSLTPFAFLSTPSLSPSPRLQVMNARMPFTVILDDPLSNSYIQNLYAPDPDPCLSEEVYERSHEQNEELGLNDMQTEDYGHVHVHEGDEEEKKEAEGEKKEEASA